MWTDLDLVLAPDQLLIYARFATCEHPLTSPCLLFLRHIRSPIYSGNLLYTSTREVKRERPIHSLFINHSPLTCIFSQSHSHTFLFPSPFSFYLFDPSCPCPLPSFVSIFLTAPASFLSPPSTFYIFLKHAPMIHSLPFINISLFPLPPNNFLPSFHPSLNFTILFHLFSMQSFCKYPSTTFFIILVYLLYLFFNSLLYFPPLPFLLSIFYVPKSCLSFIFLFSLSVLNFLTLDVGIDSEHRLIGMSLSLFCARHEKACQLICSLPISASTGIPPNASDA